MWEKIKDFFYFYWSDFLGFMLFFLFFFAVIFIMMPQEEKTFIDTEKQICEKSGGMYFPSVLGASNCVFKPENKCE